ncbi:NAD(P)/FAD-dependent oxidoreductase [Pseudemcibacter aquimaris]|uniref:NAD(P)/FAD-dependent oxidoreductase n=1 Tax=Pseudemcibacter aquimaris TaxID=2857064 RepID=UPI0020126A9F|nr:FAD-binding oxidoreductase [Pseudemcibacter aquimaris]MCC3861990.1 FAD-binding oxidoreductase [Pseudemcibacter aquimaris]WDU58742.1 FAD-binding oxidoreductase [Pseudemcibacter aquimaris]
MIKSDFIIIGAGIAGASVAYELSKHGKAIILEAESQPGYHTTGRSAAIFETTYGGGDPIIRAIVLASGKFLRNPPDGFTEHDLLHPRDMIYIAPKSDREKLTQAYEKLRKQSDNVRLIEKQEINKLIPILNENYGDLAFIMENEIADIDVHALHEGYLKGARSNGSDLHTNSKVVEIDKTGDQWIIKTESGEFSAPIIINAAGAWVDEIAQLAGVKEIGIEPLRRTVITIDAPAGIDSIDHWPMINELAEVFYFKPDAGKVLISPCDKTLSEPCDAQPEEIDVAYAAHYFQECTDIEVRKIDHKWAGLRNRTKDGYPAIGYDPEAEGFFWLAGQEGIGIMTSPALSRIAASMVLGHDIPDDIKEIGIDDAGLNVARFLK